MKAIALRDDRAATIAPAAGLPAVAWAPALTIAALKVAFQLATSTLYGFHRDEFYYLAGGHHLAWGYVDHPPLVPVLYRLSEASFGDSVTGIHVLPSVLGAVFVLVAALLVRELEGRRSAQVLAALVAAVGPVYLLPTHFLSTVTLDLLAWAIASLLLIRLVRTGDRRWWVGIGVVCGVGLLNKHTMAFWALGAVVGILATGQGRLLATRWAVVAAVIAGMLATPNLIWQATHHWATLEFDRNIQTSNAATDRAQFVPLQLGMVTLAGTLVWYLGLRAGWRDARRRSMRWLAIAYATCFVVLFVTGGKAYYLASWYLPLVALGAVVIEERWKPRSIALMSGAVVVTGILMLPLVTPLLPESMLVAAKIDTNNKDLGAMLGWPHVVDVVEREFRSLPPPDRARAVVPPTITAKRVPSICTARAVVSPMRSAATTRTGGGGGAGRRTARLSSRSAYR